MSPEPIQAESHGEGFPRVSGDEPQREAEGVAKA